MFGEGHSRVGGSDMRERSRRLWRLVAVVPYCGLVLALTSGAGKRIDLNSTTGPLFSLAAAGLGVLALEVVLRLARCSAEARRLFRWATVTLLLAALLGIWLFFGLQQHLVANVIMVATSALLIWTSSRLTPSLGAVLGPVVREVSLALALVQWLGVVTGLAPALVLSAVILLGDVALRKLATRKGKQLELLSRKLRLLAVSTILSVWVGGKFIVDNSFDLFVYQKSVEHGYFPFWRNVAPEEYGARAADITALRNAMKAFGESPESESPDASWLRNESEGKYVVALIGDSFIWGQGVRNEERFAHLLSERLNSVRPTRVLSLANCGDNLMENYLKYEAVGRIVQHIDVVVFGLVSNDLLVNPGPARYDSEGLQQILDLCPNMPLVEDLLATGGRAEQLRNRRIRLTFDPNSGYGNHCVLERLAASYLPSEDSIYFLFWSGMSERYTAALEAAGLDVLDATPALSESLNQGDWRVSPKDGHPSAKAHAVFADLLFSKIAKDPRYRFGDASTYPP